MPLKSGVLGFGFALFVASPVGSLGLKLRDELVRGIDEITALMRMAGNDFRRNCAIENLLTNPFVISTARDSKATGGEFAIDFGRDLSRSGPDRPSLLEPDVANDDVSEGGTIHRREVFGVEDSGNIAVRSTLFPKLVNALAHFGIVWHLYPLLKGSVGCKKRVMAREPDNLDFDSRAVFGCEDDL